MHGVGVRRRRIGIGAGTSFTELKIGFLRASGETGKLLRQLLTHGTDGIHVHGRFIFLHDFLLIDGTKVGRKFRFQKRIAWKRNAEVKSNECVN